MTKLLRLGIPSKYSGYLLMVKSSMIKTELELIKFSMDKVDLEWTKLN